MHMNGAWCIMCIMCIMKHHVHHVHHAPARCMTHDACASCVLHVKTRWIRYLHLRPNRSWAVRVWCSLTSTNSQQYAFIATHRHLFVCRTFPLHSLPSYDHWLVSPHLVWMSAMFIVNTSNCCVVQRSFSFLLNSVTCVTVPCTAKDKRILSLGGFGEHCSVNESCSPYWRATLWTQVDQHLVATPMRRSYRS